MPPPPRPKLTHFLCIPLVTPDSKPQLEASLSKFRTLISKDGLIPEKAVRPLGTLHLTLGVMSLLDEDSIKGALALLQSLDLKTLLAEATSNSEDSSKSTQASDSVKEVKAESSLPLSVTLTGLQSMHNPTSTSILYTSPASPKHTATSLPLYRFALSLRDRFVSEEFSVPDSRPLLLHATLVNTIYAPGVRKASGKGGGHGKSKAKLTFDATDIIEECEDVVWMKAVKVEKVAICRMGAKKGEDGEERYEVEGEIDVP